MKATKYVMRAGVGRSNMHLPSFDKALIEAGIGNYNLVRLSSILPAVCEQVDKIDLEEGSLLPTAYSTISCDDEGMLIGSAVGVGLSDDPSKVGVIMEYSAICESKEECRVKVLAMIKEAFDVRGWTLDEAKTICIDAVVGENETVSTFACIAEW